MLLFITMLAKAAGATEVENGFDVSDMPCAQEKAPALHVNLEQVRWPFKASAAKLALEAQRMHDAHDEKCTRLLTTAVDNSHQDTAVFTVASAAVSQGRTVSLDARTGQVATDVAGELRETSYGAFAMLGGYNNSDAQLGWNLGFLDGQYTATGVTRSGTSASTGTDDAATRQKSEADRKAAEATAKAQAEADRKAKIAALEAAGGS